MVIGPANVCAVARVFDIFSPAKEWKIKERNSRIKVTQERTRYSVVKTAILNFISYEIQNSQQCKKKKGTVIRTGYSYFAIIFRIHPLDLQQVGRGGDRIGRERITEGKKKIGGNEEKRKQKKGKLKPKQK
jgi:hypothetical protein